MNMRRGKCRMSFMVTLWALLLLRSWEDASAMMSDDAGSTTTSANVDFEAVLMRRLMLNSTQPSNATDVVEVRADTIMQTIEYLFLAPTAINQTFAFAKEVQFDVFWDIVSVAKTLAGLDPDRPNVLEQDIVPILDNLTTAISRLPTHLCWSVLRRIVLAALVQRRLSAGAFNQPIQAAITRLCVQLFLLHRQAAGRKGVIDFFHISKAGGTTFCQLAKLNGCRTQSFAARRNCLIREFDDVPRWVNNSLHNSLAPSGLRTPWFANWGSKQRNTVSCHIRKRYLLRRRYTVFANEFTTYGGARNPHNAHICPGHLNVLQLRHPTNRLRSHLMWVWALYDHHFKEQAGAFFPTHGSAHWHSLAPAVSDNYYVRSLLGESVYYLPHDALNASHLMDARMAITQFDVLLLLEQPAINELLFEMAVGWGLGFGSVHARTSSQVHEVGRQGLPPPEDWKEMLARNKLDLELYKFGSLLALLDSIVFDVAREAGLGGGYAAVGREGEDGGATVAGQRAVAPGDDEQWQLAGNATRRAGNCGFVSAHERDDVVPAWVVV